MDRIKEFAEKGILIAVAFDIDYYFSETQSWYYIVSFYINEFDTYYGYNTYEEALEEAFVIANNLKTEIYNDNIS